MTELETIVFEALGEASMCWLPQPSDQVFDSAKAQAIGTKLVDRIRELTSIVQVEQEPILRVAKPYIPVIDIFGVTYALRHPLENTAETKKRITELSNKYLALLAANKEGAEVTDGQRKAMYEDMGRMLNIFIPGISSGEMALLDEHDRYEIVGACYKAYEDIYARMAQREGLQEPPAAMKASLE